MSHDFEDWFNENKPPYTKDPIYISNITYTKQFVKDAWYDGYEEGRNNKWHYVTDELPPNPKESGDGISIIPLNYICAYSLNNEYDDYEIGEFMYLGNGVWNGENKRYPIYAWLDCPVNVPQPPKEK